VLTNTYAWCFIGSIGALFKCRNDDFEESRF
jgi:hypothetical protein